MTAKVIEFDPDRRFLREMVEVIQGASTERAMDLLEAFQSMAREEGRADEVLGQVLSNRSTGG